MDGPNEKKNEKSSKTALYSDIKFIHHLILNAHQSLSWENLRDPNIISRGNVE